MNKRILQIERQLDVLKEQDLLRRRRITSTPCGPVVNVDGKNMLTFCSNDYLGLASHPKIQHALVEGATLYGAGSGASHLISGHSKAHAQLEDRLAEMQSPYIDNARTLYFSTGYMANLAILSALAASDPGQTAIFSERLNHASLIDGARLARCNLHVYPHADLVALAEQLKQSSANTKIVVTDSVFSMDGVVAPLAQIATLCEKYDAWLVVDDAHGFGVLGKTGAGILEELGLQSANLIYMGTLGKAAGVSGAFVAAHGSVVEWMVQKARPYIYTTASPPALAHALLASLTLIQGDEGVQRRLQLQKLIHQFKVAFQTTLGTQFGGMALMESATQIQPLQVGDNHIAMAYAAQLAEQGIWVPAIRPPTVPVGTARLRLTLSAAHSAEQVSELISALHRLQRKVA